MGDFFTLILRLELAFQSTRPHICIPFQKGLQKAKFKRKMHCFRNFDGGLI